MKAWRALGAATLAAITIASCKHDDAPATPAAHQWSDCQGTHQAFVRRAILVIAGRRPWGQAEVDVYEDIYAGLAQGADDATARRIVTQMIAQDPAYRERWRDFFLDSLHVLRSPFVRTSTWDVVQTSNCFPTDSDRDGSLAAWVRDNPPSAQNPPLTSFRLGDLFTSSIVLDDLTPMYRTELLRMMNFALPGANVAPDILEKSRRLDFGGQFSAVFLHRDTKCLQCHNSEQSLTFDPDPEKNRAWMVPGGFERALFGTSSAEDDPLSYWSVFRHQGVADGGGLQPWGWSGDCGVLTTPSAVDPLQIPTHFASVGVGASDGSIASVWNVEAALHRGVDALAKNGLQRQADGTIPDPDVAFAYLLAMSVAEAVWRESVGTSLTIANYFPRTQVQRDALQALADVVASSHFSLKQLLVAITASPAFNPASATDACGDAPYEMPRIYNPWSNAENDAALRGNGVGDAVYPLSSRLLRRALHRAMEWDQPLDFPYALTGQDTDASIGLFVSAAEPGFRGLDFQARLAWESIYGACTPNYAESDDPGNPGYPKQNADFVSKLAGGGGTLEDAVVALKDRLLGEPFLDADERDAVTALAGVDLSSTSGLDAPLRRVCSAYLASPQFLLGGAVPSDTRAVPALTPAEHGADSVCAEAAARLVTLGEPFTLSCAGGVATVSHK